MLGTGQTVRIWSSEVDYFFIWLLPFYFACVAKRESGGVWVHATDNTDVTWFNPKWYCNADKPYGGGDAFMFHIHLTPEYISDGCFCDWDSTLAYNFICEGLMWNVKIKQFISFWRINRTILCCCVFTECNISLCPPRSRGGGWDCEALLDNFP